MIKKKRVKKVGSERGKAWLPNRTKTRTSVRILRELFDLVDKDSPESFTTLAKRLGCHKQSIYLWRSGKSAPSILNVENMAQVLGYEIVLRKIEDKS